MGKTKKSIKTIDLTGAVYMSFFLSFLALTGSTVITFIAAIGNFDDNEERFIRGALISETTVNIIAGMTYYYFMKYLYSDMLSLEKVTSVRYLDWILTTPLLLLSFAFYSNYQKKLQNLGSVSFMPLIWISIFNILMLVFGFLGETKMMSKFWAFLISFGFFGLLFYFVYDEYVKGNDTNIETVYYVLLGVWALYGLAYYLPVREKNIAYNILDMVSKSGFGIFLWASSIPIAT